MSGKETWFEQARWGYRLGFGLGDDRLHYSTKDGGSRRVFTIAYERFDLHDPMMESIPAARPGMVLFFLCAMSASLAFGYSRVPEIMLALVGIAGLFGVAFILWRTTGLFSVPFSVFADDHGGEAFRIIRDRQHDRIVAAIAGMRREHLRRIWGVLDMENDLAAERARFDWLLSNDVVDADEHAAAIRRIAAAERAEGSGRLH